MHSVVALHNVFLDRRGSGLSPVTLPKCHGVHPLREKSARNSLLQSRSLPKP